jgi:acyl-CoA reductase-like NAD-dependent aldehyde dehydrogenase
MYPNSTLYINGAWTPSNSGQTLPVVNPASGQQIGTVAHADRTDLDRALEAARKGFNIWREVSAFERSKTMRKAATLMRERAEAIAPVVTLEQGQTLTDEIGMITIDHLGLASLEVPFGGVKDSGYGSECGMEGIESYLNPKFISQSAL